MEKYMTYDEIVERFEIEIKPLVIKEYGADDVIAMREAFNNWTDSLCKDDEISNEMYDTMDNPY